MPSEAPQSDTEASAITEANSLRAVGLAVGQAEHIAAEDAATRRVPDRVVMAGVAGSVEEQQLAAAEIEPEIVFRHQHARLRHRHNLAVHLRHRLRAVHRSGSLDQLGRVDHVPRPARVHHQHRLGQLIENTAFGLYVLVAYNSIGPVFYDAAPAHFLS